MGPFLVSAALWVFLKEHTWNPGGQGTVLMGPDTPSKIADEVNC